MSRSAVAQDWFLAPGGSEEVAVQLARMLPGSDVHTSFVEPEYRSRLEGHAVKAWPFQRAFGPTRHFRAFLPLYPLYFGALDLRRYALVVSSSVAFSHAVRTAPAATHIAYIHTPMRYGWDLETYLAGSSWSFATRLVAKSLAGPLRRWSRATAARPDVLIANSETVRQRIRARWGREAEVIYPPVDVASIEVSSHDDGFLLVAARMLAYRRLDLAIDACTRLDRELVVVGDGPERKRLEARAGRKVRFLGRIDRPDLLDLFSRCHAYLAPGVEDFGIAPVDAMAAGKPVVGFRGGGVAETVLDGQTGLLFNEPTSDSMAAAIDHLESIRFDPARIRTRAEEFSTPVFHRRFVELFQRLGVDPSLYRSTSPDPADQSPRSPSVP